MSKRFFRSGRPSFGPVIFFAVALAMSLYFTFAAGRYPIGFLGMAIRADNGSRRANMAAGQAFLKKQLETLHQ